MDSSELRKLWEKVISEDDLQSEEIGNTYKSSLSAFETLYANLPIMTFSGNKLLAETNDKDNKVPDTTPTIDGNKDISQDATSTIDASQDTTATLSGDTEESSIDIEKSSIAIDSQIEKLSQYQVVGEIARGGMGVIFKAHQQCLQREIALKKLITQEDNQRNKFVAESLTTAFLDHPNIVPVYELGENEQGEVVLAMKLVGGTSWNEILHQPQQENPYDLLQHLEILLDVCNAVAFAHSKGIIHNDLKPANVMIGEFGEVLVMDWGIAVNIHEASDPAKALHKSMVNGPMGTPSYMPVELIEGQADVIGPWTDIYLLGGILYEILEKQPPHQGDTVWQTLVKARKGTPPLFTVQTPEELQDICKKALAREPQNRYQSVEEFQQVIREYIKHRESIAISDRAQQILQKCSENQSISAESYQIYDQLVQSISAFQRAQELWKQNDKAVEGEHYARLFYARMALANEDLNVAEGQIQELDKNLPEVQSIYNQIIETRDNKIRAKRASVRLRRAFKIAVVAIVCILFIGIILIYREQKRTEQQRNKAQFNAVTANKERKRAQQNAEIATVERVRAEKLKNVAEKQRVEKAKDARNTRIRLAKIALSKARSSAYIGKWSESGVYGGEVLETIKGLSGLENLEKEGRELIATALEREPLLWKTTSRYLAPQQIAYSPHRKMVASFANDMEVKNDYAISLWNIKTGQMIRKFIGHNHNITRVAFSSDGKTIASSSHDKSVCLWQVATGKQLQKFIGHEDFIFCVNFSPDGSKLVSSSRDKTIIIWEIKTGQIVHSLKGHGWEVVYAVYSPDGKMIASGAENIRLWDANNGKQYAEQELQSGLPVEDMAFSADSKFLIYGHSTGYGASETHLVNMWEIGGEHKTLLHLKGVMFSIVCHPQKNNIIAFTNFNENDIKLWDIATNKKIASFPEILHPFALTFDPQGNVLASINAYGVGLWDIAQNKKITTSNAPMRTVAFSPDGNIVATGSSTIRLWDIWTGKQIAEWPGHKNLISSLAFTPDGRLLISGAADGEIKSWEVESGRNVHNYKGHKHGVTRVVIRPDMRYFASGAWDRIWIWDMETGEARSFVPQSRVSVSDIIFSPNGEMMAAAVGVNLYVWDVTTGRPLHSVRHKGAIKSITFSPSNQHILAASYDRTIHLWQLSTNSKIANISVSGSPDQVLFHPSGEFFLCSIHNNIILFNLLGKKMREYRGHSHQVLDLAFRDNYIFASVGADQTLRLWEVPFYKKKVELNGHSEMINDFAFSPDQKLFISCSDDGSIQVWDMATYKNIGAFYGHSGRVAAVEFHPDGEMVASGAQNRNIILWDLTGKKLATLAGHQAEVDCLAFSPDGKILASGSWDTTVKLWKVATKKEWKTFTHASGVEWVIFTPQGDKIASASWDNTIRIWDIHSGKLSETYIGHDNSVFAIAFNTDGTKFASAGKDGAIIIWNRQQHRQISKFILPNHMVLSLSFYPDGNTFAAAVSDGTVRLYDANTGNEIARLVDHTKSVDCVVYSPDGKILASSSGTKITLREITAGREIIERERLQNGPVFFSQNYRMGSKETIIKKIWQKPKKTAQKLFSLQVDADLAVTRAQQNAVLFSYQK